MGFDINRLPSKPDPSSVDPKDQKQLLEYQQQSQEYWFAVQTLLQMQKEEGESKSNVSKAIHDAMQSIISNIRS